MKNNNPLINTLSNKDILISKKDFEYNYQVELTKKLDEFVGDFTQAILNEVVLWKVNRYAIFSDEIISDLNNIKNQDINIKDAVIRDILKKLLLTKGVQLPMASTILRFINPNIFQIIDQRVYRLIYGHRLKTPPVTSKNVSEIIDLYIEYLKILREVCILKDVPFSKSDRVFYNLDRRINSKIKIH
ncbi:MAG: hypothetical protein FJX80_09180 [Bacteroidetes bacterium]|nr:hypothetical protein [Bacteroidota bacterium]